MKVFKINDKVITRINRSGTKVALAPPPEPTIAAIDGSLVMDGLWTYDSLYVKLRCVGFNGPVTINVEEPETKHNINVTITDNIVEFTSDDLLGDGMYGVGQVWNYVATITATDSHGHTATAVANFEIKNSWNLVELLPGESVRVNTPSNTLISDFKFYILGTPRYTDTYSTPPGTSEKVVDYGMIRTVEIIGSPSSSDYISQLSGRGPRITELQEGIEYYIYEVYPQCWTTQQKAAKSGTYVTLRNTAAEATNKLLAYRGEIVHNHVDNVWNNPKRNVDVESVCELNILYDYGTSKVATYTIEEGELYPYVFMITGDDSRRLQVIPGQRTINISGSPTSTYIVNKHRKWSNTISN